MVLNIFFHYDQIQKQFSTYFSCVPLMGLQQCGGLLGQTVAISLFKSLDGAVVIATSCCLRSASYCPAPAKTDSLQKASF
ncbi:hypothetical protein CW304_31905 [Bacillus sp. UFRGS-B20]|nr:hypothetical protein CW304_31905 [Bacillus sp. UFRGS-B20]